MTFEAQACGAIARVFDGWFAVPATEAFARSGSFLLRLCFARGKLAEEILPTFLPCEAGPADLQIGFLTGEEVDLSALVPHPSDDYHAMAREQFFAVWVPDDLPLLYLFDRRTNRALIWLAAGAAPVWFAGRPILPIMYAFSTDKPWLAIHAAAVGRDDRILLLAGPGRAGKTTAALSCARSGWDYAGDDYVFANTATGAIESLFCSARLREDMFGAFPDLVDESTNVSLSNGERRCELTLAGHFGPARIRGGALAAILLPRRNGAALPQFMPARRLDAVAALYTSMTGQMDWADTVMRKTTSLVGLAPVFFVDTGQTPEAIPEAFAAFLDRL